MINYNTFILLVDQYFANLFLCLVICVKFKFGIGLPNFFVCIFSSDVWRGHFLFFSKGFQQSSCLKKYVLLLTGRKPLCYDRKLSVTIGSNQ